jgi:hypothetical protein
MLLIETEDDLGGMPEFVAKQREAGVDIRILTGDEAMKIEPAIAKEKIVGATHSQYRLPPPRPSLPCRERVQWG